MNRAVYGPQELEILPLLDGDEFDFKGFTSELHHRALKEAPKWVKVPN
ncbi:hypothetical protein ACHQI7_09550 [Klebsiella oxytoca]|nr:hypothetical protein [Escherichia coli]